ncbi:MAG: FGGY-family carbohydrate kinase [Candidatus Acidiferrum sp.]
MSGKGLLLAIDQGTTNTKTVLVASDGRPVFVTSMPVGLLHPQPDWVEQDALALWSSVEQCVAKCISAAADKGGVRAVGISNQRETIVAWERATGKPVAPAIIWQCRRASAICAELHRQGAEQLLRERTGLAIDPLFSAGKIRWLLETVSGLRQRAEAGEICFGTVDSWLIYKLTGGHAHLCDASNASRTQLYNLRTGQWDHTLVQLFGVPFAALPDVRDSSGLFGDCTAITALKGVPILSAMGDSHAALAGHGSYSAGTVKATYGTGSSVMTLIRDFRLAQTGVATTIAWRLGGKTQFALEGNISMTGSAIQWVGEFLGLAAPTDEAIKLAETVPNSAGIYFVPAMVGLGAPYWDTQVRGAVLELERNTRAAHLAHAAVESIAFQIRDVFEAMEAAAACPLPSLNVDGGATRNNWLMQFQADVLGRPVRRSQCQELSALGAAWMAGLALGWWNSLAEIQTLRGETQNFLPANQADSRQRRYAGWKRAVAQARFRPACAERMQ